jgi:Domain of unknown function (DUF4365)
MTTDPDRMEALSRAYTFAVAAACGLTCSERPQDFGIDLTLHEVSEQDGMYFESGFRLDVQLKSTTRAAETAVGVGYDLDVRTYDFLRQPVEMDRVLLVLTLPVDPDEWVRVRRSRLEIRGAMYWASLRNRPAVPNRRSVRVTIPRQQLFTPKELGRIMGLIRTKRRLT